MGRVTGKPVGTVVVVQMKEMNDRAHTKAVAMRIKRKDIFNG